MATLVNFMAVPVSLYKDSVLQGSVAPEGRIPAQVEAVGAVTTMTVSGNQYNLTARSKFQTVLTDGTDLTAFPAAVADVYYIVDEPTAIQMARTDVVWADDTGANTLFYSGR